MNIRKSETTRITLFEVLPVLMIDLRRKEILTGWLWWTWVIQWGDK